VLNPLPAKKESPLPDEKKASWKKSDDQVEKPVIEILDEKGR